MSELTRLIDLVVARSAGLVLYARQWVDGGSADDVVQTALASLLGQQRVPDDPVAWMYCAVRNAAIDAARAESRRRKRERSVASARSDWFTASPADALDAADAEAALRELPADAREVVVLRLWGNLGFAEIAGILGVSVSTAHARYTAALGQLRNKLEQPCKMILKRD